jgi:flagellar motor protein MotB
MTELLEDPNKRFSFGGFACAIGATDINQKLSTRRANRFHNEMIKFVRLNHPEFFGEVKQKLDTAKGFGESKPLIIRHLNGKEVLIGNNEQALGRKLNRRIEIIFSIPVNVRHRLN